MKRLLCLAATCGVAAVTAVIVAVPAHAATAPTAANVAAYVAVTPVRAVDTRLLPTGPIPGGAVYQQDLSPYISSTATAAVLNVTVTNPTDASYLSVSPNGSTATSSINFRAGEIRSNEVTVSMRTGSDKSILIYNHTGRTDVVVDVLGYYDPARDGSSAGSALFPVTPYRALDTRTDTGPLPPGGSRTVTVQPGQTVPPAVTAVAVNLTAVDPSGQGYLTAWSGAGAVPGTSSVNYGTDPVTPNFAVVPAVQHPDGTVTFRVDNSVARTDVVVDVVGYYGAQLPFGLLYAASTPTRVVDTRGAQAPSLTAGGTRTFAAATTFGTRALALNITAVDATTGTFLTVYPAGTATRPGTSTLNVAGPAALANATQVGVASVGSSGVAEFSVYNLTGTVDLVVDLQGWFLPVNGDAGA